MANRLSASATSSGTGEVRVYNVDAVKPVSTFAGQKGGVYAVAALRECDGQVEGRGRLPFSWLPAGDENQLWRVPGSG